MRPRRSPDRVNRCCGGIFCSGRTLAARPGLAVDQVADRAFVVGQGTPVADIDLDTLAVAYHDLSTPVSLIGRVRAWLEPTASSKAHPSGPTRTAAWLGDGRLLISGYDVDIQTVGGKLQLRAMPAGLKVIDTRDWGVRTIDSNATSFVVAKRRLLAWSWRWDSLPIHVIGSGLTGYDSNGRPIPCVRLATSPYCFGAGRPGYRRPWQLRHRTEPGQSKERPGSSLLPCEHPASPGWGGAPGMERSRDPRACRPLGSRDPLRSTPSPQRPRLTSNCDRYVRTEASSGAQGALPGRESGAAGRHG
jgi:hypothetical protein